MTPGRSSQPNPEGPRLWTAEVEERFFFVPIIHHSPWSFQCVERAIEALKPDRIAVQLPSDAERHVETLTGVKKFPIALYGFAPGDVRSRVYAPLSTMSPEVAALRSGLPCDFIDVPMEFGGEIPEVARALGAASTTRSLGESTARLFGSLSLGHLHEMFTPDREPSSREQFMVKRLRDVKEERVLVVLGAAHCATVAAVLTTGAKGSRAFSSTWETWCVPYDEQRLHQRGGHVFPRWQRLALDNNQPITERLATLVATIGQRSRKELQEGCTVPDEIEALGSARLLARFRDLPEPGVYELLDGIRLAMVAGRGGESDDVHDLSATGPFGELGEILERELVGRARGVVPKGAGRVPLWADAQQRLEDAAFKANHLRLDVLRSPKDRRRSQLLHQLAWLGVPGVELVRDSRNEQGDIEWLFERWRVAIDAETEQHLVDAAPRGPTVVEACTAVLEERLEEHALGAVEATWLLERCLQMGLEDAAQGIIDRIQKEIALRAPFVELGEAVAQVLLLIQSTSQAHVDPRLETLANHLADRAAIALTRVGSDPADNERLRWLAALQNLFLHVCSEHDSLRAREFANALEIAAHSGPFLRGAGAALLMALGHVSTEAVATVVYAECGASRADPIRFSAFMTGVLLASSGVLTRSPPLVGAIDLAFYRWSEETFFTQLPDLRLAFSALTTLDIRLLVALLTEPHATFEELPVTDGDARLSERLSALGVAEPAGPSSSSPSEAPPPTNYSALQRWRLVLGDHRFPWPEDVGLSDNGQHQNSLLDTLYSQPRQRGTASQAQPTSGAGGDQSTLSPAAALSWLAECREAFAEQTVQRLQEHALHHFGMKQILLDPSVISQLQPSLGIAKVLVQLRDHIPPESLDYVRRLIRRVVQDIRKHFERRMRPSLQGTTRSRERTPLRIARNLDLARTVRDNLQNTDPETGRLGIETIAFTSRVRRKNTWRILLLVDQSGSMVEAAIDAAVLGGVFASLSALETHLVAFDSEPRDLSAWVHDTAEVLLRRIPGGGTHISRALRYAETLVTAPTRTLCVVVTDLYEGGPVSDLIAAFSRMKSAGIKSLVLTGVGSHHQPHDPVVARQLEELGIPTKALAPEDLAHWIAQAMR